MVCGLYLNKAHAMTDKVLYLYLMKIEKETLPGAVERARALESETLDNLFSLLEPKLLICELGLLNPISPCC